LGWLDSYCKSFLHSPVLHSNLTSHPQWTPERAHSIQAIPAHQTCIYQAIFSPHEADVVASCSTDGSVRVFDLRAPSQLAYPAPAITIPAHSGEILSLDWNKWQPHILATGSVDRLIRIWDTRMVKTGEMNGGQTGGVCIKELAGHEYAVRKVQWSNFAPDLLASASYDMTSRM
jgi:peroxin-7